MTSIYSVRLLIFVTICFTIAQTYPSSMSKHEWFHEPSAYRPSTNLQISSDRIDTNPMDDETVPFWFMRSRKFCCAPPL